MAVTGAMNADALIGYLTDLYEHGVEAEGRFHADAERAGLALTWLAANRPASFGPTAVERLRALRAKWLGEEGLCEQYRFRLLPVDCTLFLLMEDYDMTPCVVEGVLFRLTYRDRYLDAAIKYMAHGLSALRSFAMECFYYVASQVYFRRPSLLFGTTTNLKHAVMYRDWNLYLLRRAQGNWADKVEWADIILTEGGLWPEVEQELRGFRDSEFAHDIMADGVVEIQTFVIDLLLDLQDVEE